MQTASASPAPRSARWRARGSTPTSRGWRASPAHGPCRERRTWRACGRGRHPGAPCRISHATSAGGRRGSRGGSGRRSPHIQEALRQAMRWHSKARAMNILSGAPSGCSAPRPGSGRKAGSGSRRLACPQKTDAVILKQQTLPRLPFMQSGTVEADGASNIPLVPSQASILATTTMSALLKMSIMTVPSQMSTLTAMSTSHSRGRAYSQE